MPTDVESEPLVLRGLRDAAKDVRRLEHRNRVALLRQNIGGCQPSRAPADHDRVITGLQTRYLAFLP